MKVDIASVKTEITSLKIDVAWLRGRSEGVEKHISHLTNITYALIALVILTVGLPLIIRLTSNYL